MKKIFILSILLTLTFGYAYGEIIQITNSSNSWCYKLYFPDVHRIITPILTQQGGIYWMERNGSGSARIQHYNGNNIVTVDVDGFYKFGEYNFLKGSQVVQGEKLVYDKSDGWQHEIYMFDGQTGEKKQITDTRYLNEYSPVINDNGYIAWIAMVLDTNGNQTDCGDVYLYKPDQPTAVQMSSLKATPSNKQVKLEWQTETEVDNAGFNVWRAEGFQKMNVSLIPALGSPTAGSEYDFVDQWVLNGKRYFYLLEDIDSSGISTFHGPVKATPRWIYGAGK